MEKISIAKKIWHHFSAHRRFNEQIKKYEKHIKECKNQGDKTGKRTIVFLINFPESWNSVKSIYAEACGREDVAVKVVAVPRSVANIDDNRDISGLRNEAYEFFSQTGIPAIKANEKSEWFDLKSLNPDYVIYTRPYNQDYPFVYQSDNVCTFAKLCYIPYAYSMLSNGILVMPEGFVLSTHRIFLANESRKNECCMRFPNYIKENKKRFQYLGFPRFDLYGKDEERADDRPFTIAWLPRWTVDEGKNKNKGSHFLLYCKDFLEYAKKNPDVKVIIRPHPNMFPNYIEKGIMSEEEVDAFKKQCEACGVVIDRDKDYIKTIKTADVLVADYTSLIAEYFMTGKPIIYCDTADGLNEEGTVICGNLYDADSFAAVEDYLEKIKNSKDEDFSKREGIIKKLLPAGCGNIGKTILDNILNS